MTSTTASRWLMLLCFATLFSGCAVLRQPEPPNLSIVDVRLQDMTLFEQRYRMTLRISNPNDFELPVERVHYEIFLEGDLFAEGNSVGSFVVPALGENRFDVIVSSSLLRTARHAANLMQGGRDQLDYEMKGFAVVDLPFAGRVPFSDSGSLQMPTPRR